MVLGLVDMEVVAAVEQEELVVLKLQELLVDMEVVVVDSVVEQLVLEALVEQQEEQEAMEVKVQEVRLDHLVDMVVLKVQELEDSVEQDPAMAIKREQNINLTMRNCYILQKRFLALTNHCRDSVSVLIGDSPTSSHLRF